MLHSEDPSKMFLDQEFPVSIEAQFLGGSGERDRPTLNMCSPGTEVDINGYQALKHCVFSNSKTYHDEEWISVEFIVYSDSIVHHVIGRDTVMTYSNIKIGVKDIYEVGLKIDIYDISGKIIHSIPVNDLSDTFYSNWDGAGFSSGIYFLKLNKTFNNQIKKIMFIK